MPLVNPRLGMRRIRGVWPPSKPMSLPSPERERWPFGPRVAVWPVPEPSPMPRRIGRRREPGTGSRLEREMISFGATEVLALATLFSTELEDVFLRAKKLEGLERRADH